MHYDPPKITWVTCSAYRLRWWYHGVLVCGNKRVRLDAACILILILSMVRHWWIFQVIQGLYWWCWCWCWRYRCMILNSCTNKLRMFKLMLTSHEQRLSSSYFSDLNKLMLTSYEQRLSSSYLSDLHKKLEKTVAVVLRWQLDFVSFGASTSLAWYLVHQQGYGFVAPKCWEPMKLPCVGGVEDLRFRKATFHFPETFWFA